MGILLLAGAKPGSGVTAAIAGMANLWTKSGKSVRIVKPFTLDNNSADKGSSLFYSGIPQHDLYQKNDQIIKVKDEILNLSKSVDITLVEGLPLTDNQGSNVDLSSQLAKELEAKVLGIQPFIDVEIEEAFQKWDKTFGNALHGVFVNMVPPNRKHYTSNDLPEAAANSSVKLLAVIPEDRTMVSPSVAQIIEHVSARTIDKTLGTNPLVENFLIGGLLMEWGGNYFGRFSKQGIIVRGGRIDIQMSALNFPMSCMLLTACSNPQQYVQQRAEAQGVPLMFVEEGTMEVANSMASIAGSVNVHHPDKAARFSELIRDNCDIDSLT